MSEIKKVAAIFSNHQSLKTALHSLEAQGLTDISVLVKSEADQTESTVRTYSTATYPKTGLQDVGVASHENRALGQRHIEGMVVDSDPHVRENLRIDREDARNIDK